MGESLSNFEDLPNQYQMATLMSYEDWLQCSEATEKDERLFLTEKEVRSLPKFKNATEAEVANIIQTLHDLALVTYELFCQEAADSQDYAKAA
jgi:hypothetical protein